MISGLEIELDPALLRLEVLEPRDDPLDGGDGLDGDARRVEAHRERDPVGFGRRAAGEAAGVGGGEDVVQDEEPAVVACQDLCKGEADGEVDLFGLSAGEVGQGDFG